MRHEIKIDLAGLELSLLAHIDSEAESVRGRFITNTPSQPSVYLAKESEALSFMADQAISPELIPNLVREAARENMAVFDVAATILFMAHNWRQISAVIEDLRLGAKSAVRAASTVGDKRQAAIIDWTPVITLEPN